MKPFFVYAFVLLLILMVPNLSWAQNSGKYIVTTRLLNVEDGLASREVFCGLQDSKGFIWLGTRNGLNRYDGENFLLFTEENGLQSKRVLQLVEDGTGNLWIKYGNSSSDMVSSGKVDILNEFTNQVNSITISFKNLPFNERDIASIFSDGRAGVYIFTFKGVLWHYSPDNGFRISKTPEKNDLAFWITNGFDQTYRTILPVSSGLVLNKVIDSIDMIIHPFKDDSRLKLVKPDALVAPLLFNDSGSIAICEIGNHAELVNLCYGRTVYWKKAPDELQIGSFDKLLVFNDLRSNSAVFRTPRGIFYYDGKEVQPLLDSQVVRHTDMAVYSYFCDGTKKRWLCTSTGVYIIKTEPNKFKHYFSSQQLPSLANNQARGIYADTAGNVYANIWNRLCISRAGKYGQPEVRAKKELLYPLLSYNDTLLYAFGNCIGEYDRIKDNFNDLPCTNEVWAAYILNNKNILLGDFHTPEIFNPATKQVTKPDCNNIFMTYFYRFFKGVNGQLWGVAENGLYTFSNNGCVTDYYGNEARDKKHNLPLNGLNDAYQDSSGIFWLATSGDGLLRWNPVTDSILRFSRNNGFSSATLYRIEADGHHNLWISTDYGLARFNTLNNSIYTYTVKNGISHNEFNRISSFRAFDGRLYFGGMNGVDAFFPDDFTADTSMLNAPLRITSFNQFDGNSGAIVEKTIQLRQSKEIVLAPGDRFFDLAFRLLDYENEPHTYAYRIEGLDKGWNYITENSIRISGLPYGRFALIIKGQDMNGQWSSEQLKISVLVVKPFYLRAWFFVVLTMLLISLVYVFVYYRTRQLERDNLKLETTVAARTGELSESLKEKESLLAEVHHRVKNNLQTISSLLDLQSRNVSDQSAKNAIIEGQNRVRSIALIHQSLYQNENFGTLEFSAFVNELALSVKDVFFREGYFFDFVNTIPETWFDVDTAVPLALIINELLTNSFKYSYDSSKILNVAISLTSQKEGNFILEYRDSGPGLPLDFDLTKAKSLGLRLINRLSKQLVGGVKYRFEQGSVFQITFKNTAERDLEE